MRDAYDVIALTIEAAIQAVGMCAEPKAPARLRDYETRSTSSTNSQRTTSRSTAVKTNGTRT